MGCKVSKISSDPENFDERWNNKTGLCLALRFEAGEEKSVGLKCGIEKKGYHTKRERKGETPIPEDVAKDSALTERSEGTVEENQDRIPHGVIRTPSRIEESKELVKKKISRGLSLWKL